MPDISYAAPEDPRAKRAVIRAIERLTGQRAIKRLYARSFERTDGEQTFWTSALQELDITLDYDASKLDAVPPEGPVIFVANHPYGVLDGLVICHLASRVRAQFRILINRILCREERIAHYLLPIDFRETPEATRINIGSMRNAIQTLNEDGAVVIFPAGGIATAHKPFGPAVDLEWKPFAARLVQHTEATVIPIYFHGQNSRLFQWASRLSQTLRMSLIVHELDRRRGSTVSVTVGDPIPYDDLAEMEDREALTRYLRSVTHALPVSASAHGKP
jgi:putative hemolysin